MNINHNTEMIYNTIQRYTRKRGFPPSIREIANVCELGTSTVTEHLLLMESRGIIERNEGQARTIVIRTPLVAITKALDERMYGFISTFIKEKGISPTYAEICEACRCSEGTVARHLRKMEASGLIGRLGRHVRGIYLLDSTDQGN
jgi:SOS-response transcriptional repressor LexA